MRVFLAGATGVIGSRLVPMLRTAGHQVTGMTRSPQKADALRALGAEPAICDALDPAALEEAVAAGAPEVVVHELTALPKRIDPRRMERDFALNDRLREEGTSNLVQAARNAGARRIVAQSVAFAYAPTRRHEEGGGESSSGGLALHTEDDPLYVDAPGPFQRSVRALCALERAVLEAHDLEGVVLRYGYFYGPGSSYAADGSIAAEVRRRRFPIGGHGTGVWPFIHVDDAARATLAALQSDRTGVFNIVDDDPAPIGEWLPAYAEALGAKHPRRLPLLLVRLFAGEYTAHLMSTAGGASNRRAKQELGWEPQHPSWREGFRTALG
jgi:2-alkyl-3-oxoalkanoate reductase